MPSKAAKKSPAATAPAPRARKVREAEAGDHQIHEPINPTNDALSHFDSDVHDFYREDWKPDAHLAAPEPRDGWVQRWVRATLVGKADPQNIARQSRTGWIPRSLSSVPAGERKRYPAVNSTQFGDIMQSGDLILCEMPQKRFAQMQAYYRDQSAKQVNALVSDHITKTNSGPGNREGFGPIEMRRKSEASVRRPIVAADDEN